MISKVGTFYELHAAGWHVRIDPATGAADVSALTLAAALRRDHARLARTTGQWAREHEAVALLHRAGRHEPAAALAALITVARHDVAEAVAAEQATQTQKALDLAASTLAMLKAQVEKAEPTLTQPAPGEDLDLDEAMARWRVSTMGPEDWN